MFFERKTVTITPLLKDAFLISSQGDAKVLINPPTRTKFFEFNENLGKVLSKRVDIAATHSPEEIANTWTENLVIIPKNGPRRKNILPVERDDLFSIDDNWTLSFPLHQQKNTSPFILIRGFNIRLLYVASHVHIPSPPQVDLLLIPKTTLQTALKHAENIHHLPIHIGCEPQFIITQHLLEKERPEIANIPHLYQLTQGQSITIARHLTTVKKLTIENDITSVLPELKLF